MDPIGPFLIPVTVLFGVFAIVVVAMILKSQAKDRQHRERMFMAEKGIEIPKELYDLPQPPKQSKPNGYRAGRAWLIIIGLVMVFVGIGVMISLGVRQGMHEGVQGIIPLLIGVSFLVSERLIARVVNKSERE
jgi:hypothetical protein